MFGIWTSELCTEPHERAVGEIVIEADRTFTALEKGRLGVSSKGNAHSKRWRTCPGACWLTLTLLATASFISAEAAAQVSAQASRSELQQASHDSTDLKGKLTKLVCSGWAHGMPRSRVIELGHGVLPILGEMLRSNGYRRCWGPVCVAIGAMGDTSYFDTLRTFVWDRYEGKVDIGAEMQIMSAQDNIARLAAGSNRAVDYLIRMSEPAAWQAAPWDFPDDGREEMARRMAETTIKSLSVVDHERARQFIEGLSVEQYAAAIRPPGNDGAPAPYRRDSLEVESLRRVSREVHSMGLRQWSFAQEERLHR